MAIAKNQESNADKGKPFLYIDGIIISTQI